MARLREGRLRKAGTGVLALELGDDVVEISLRAEALTFQDFHNDGDFPHVGHGGFIDGRAFAFGGLASHLWIGCHFRVVDYSRRSVSALVLRGGHDRSNTIGYWGQCMSPRDNVKHLKPYLGLYCFLWINRGDIVADDCLTREYRQ